MESEQKQPLMRNQGPESPLADDRQASQVKASQMSVKYGWAVAGVAIVVFLVWAAPEIGGMFKQSQVQAEEQAKKDKWSADFEQSNKEREAAFTKKYLHLGITTRVAELLAQKSLTDGERQDLDDCAFHLGIEDPAKATFDENGHILKVEGQEAYFNKIRAKLDSSKKAPESPSATDAPKTAEAFDSNLPPERQLIVKQWSLVETRGQDGETTYEVSGELRNPTNRSFQFAFLDVSLYDDKGNIVATSHVHADNVAAGETAIITGYVIDKTNTPHPKGKIRLSQVSSN